MRALWLTRQDPRPADSGELIYSKGLLDALARCPGVEITVLAHSSGREPEESGPANIRWVLPVEIPGRKLKDLLSPLPSDASRLGGRAMKAALESLLTEEWDALVIDQAACGWPVQNYEKLPPVVYLSHNHEAVIRPQIANCSHHSFPKRLVLSSDATSYARLEQQLVRRASLVTTITAEDAEEFRRTREDLRTLVLTPGYEREPATPPTAAGLAKRPRRAVLTGSFQWIAKARNLEDFLAAADRVFPAKSIELAIVGKCDPAYFERLGQQYPWVKFHPNVPSIQPYLDESRIGVLPDTLGGGFKLKALDYIFQGLPLAAVTESLRGLPQVVCDRVMKADSQEDLARQIAGRIDDVDWLAESAALTLERQRDAYSWKERGEALAEALNRLKS